jgi:TonB family protein
VETLTQRVPEAKGHEELQIPDSLSQPFLDIARHSLRRDPQSRWTVADISARLNPQAISPAPNVSEAKTSAPAIPEPIKPAAASPSGAAAATVIPANVPENKTTATAAKPAASIDPLSVPLSPVRPLPSLTQHALENQTVEGRTKSYRSYYIVVAILIALTVGAMIAIPRLRELQSDPDTSSAPARPAVQPDQSLTPAKQEPPAVAKPEADSPKKPATTAPDRPIEARPERSSVQPPQTAPQDSVKTASEKQFVKKDQPANDSTSAKIASSSSTARPMPPPANPSIAAPVAPPIAVMQGEPLNQVLPEVSAKSRSTIHGTVRVVIKLHVDASGNVTAAEPASSPSRFFADAALQAAKGWDFAPAKIAGQTVPSEWLVRFDFTQADVKVLPSQTKP